MISRRVLIVAVAIVCYASMMHSQSSATLFFDDFETQDFSAWTSTFGTYTPEVIPGGAVVSTQAHSGLYSFAATLPAQGGSAKLLETITPSTEVYLRYYLYIPSTFVMGNYFVISNIGGGCELALRTSGSKLYLQDWNGNLGTHSLLTNTWHAIEIHSMAGSGNGIETVWIDGAQDINLTNLSITGPFTSVYVGPENADGTQTGSLFYDDVTIQSGGSQIGAPAANITVRYPNTAVRSAIPVDVVMFGQAASDSLVASVDSSVVYTKTGSMTAHERFAVSFSSLSAGDHTFQVVLLSSSQAQKATFSGTLHKYVAGTPGVYIDENNIVYHNGIKLFLVMQFIDGETEWASAWLANNAVNTYGWVACYASGYAYTYSQFNTCMNTISAPVVGPDNNWTGSSASQYAANDPNAVANATAYVVNDSTNPNLFMWTWQDEPDIGPAPGQVTPSRMLALAQSTHSNDGNHPVITNMAGYPFSLVNNRQDGWYYPIVPNTSELVTDVYSFDMYPIIYQTSGWTVAQLVSDFDRAGRYTYGLVPWYTDIEGGICDTGLPCQGYGPTPAQTSMEAWLAVIHGIKGISWWGPSGWTTQDAAHWAAMASFVTQVSAFSDAILSTTPLTVTSNMTVSGSRVDVTVREDSSFIYVFAARLSEIAESTYPAITANLSVSNFANNRTVEVPFESRAVPMLNGVITDTFSPSAVHLYCIPKSAAMPLPPCGLVAKAK